MKNVLITGAGGFIGSRLAIRLAGEGKNVIALVNNLGNAHEQELFQSGCTLELGSVTDYDRMRSLISMHEIDTVFHLAAYAIVRLSARDPMSTYSVNVMGTVNLLEACRVVGGVKSIIVASSDKAYGDHEQLPYLETHPLQPKNTYDTSKACMDMISRSYAHNYEMPIYVTRCSNVYGPGDRNWSRVIPNSIRRTLSGDSPVVYSDVENMTREFIYIDDVIEAYVLLADHCKSALKSNYGQAYNIGGTKAVKVIDVVQKIMEKLDRGGLPSVVHRENTFMEIKDQYIDAELLKKHTGWASRVSLDEGLEKTIEWVQANL